MPIAEIISIGTELLLGETQDTNTRFIARRLKDAGIDLYRTMTVGDNTERIATAIQESLQRSQIIITTGGLGPTVDDPTRQAIADAMGVNLEFREDLWQQIEDRFKKYGRPATENNRRQAYIPHGAKGIENPVGTAPAFLFEREDCTVICLPGVPREMEYLLEHWVMPYLHEHYDLNSIIKIRVLHAAGVGESQVDEIIGDLERLQNPTVGLSAHPGQIDIRITAKAPSEAKAQPLIEEIEGALRLRLGEIIYGSDGERLEDVVVQQLKSHEWEMVVVESGSDQELSKRLLSAGIPLENLLSIDDSKSHTLQEQLQRIKNDKKAEVGLGIDLQPGSGNYILSITLITPPRSLEAKRYFGGAPDLRVLWAVNHTLDYLRRCL